MERAVSSRVLGNLWSLLPSVRARECVCVCVPSTPRYKAVSHRTAGTLTYHTSKMVLFSVDLPGRHDEPVQVTSSIMIRLKPTQVRPASGVESRH